MGVLVDAPGRIVNAHGVHCIEGAQAEVLTREFGLGVQFKCLRDLLAHGVDGVEAGHRLLEDHCDVAPTDMAKFAFVEGQEIGAGCIAAEADAASIDTGVP